MSAAAGSAAATAAASATRAHRLAAWTWRLALVVAFLAWFAQFYRPGFGFTYVLIFPRAPHDERVLPLRDAPIYEHDDASYDGQMYVQLAVDPLLRDPSIDRALDVPAFRARRILFCWTAWAIGLGRPAWILQAYSVQNVLFWLLLAWWLWRRFPSDTARDVAVWSACLLAPGLLDSARMALLDGPGLLVIALGLMALERGRFWIGSAVLGVAGLGRETSLLTGVALAPRRLSVRGLIRSVGGGVVFFLPTVIWLDYLRSIYRSHTTQALDQLVAPVVSYLQEWPRLIGGVVQHGWAAPDTLRLLALAGITAQAAYLLSLGRWRSPWWRVGVAFVALMLLISPEIWLGAYLRVLLPLTLAFNLLLPRGRWFWAIFVIGNMGVVESVFRIGVR